MLRTVLRLTPAIALPFFDTRSAYDKNKIGQFKEESNSGYERVKKMFSSSENYPITPELHTVAQMGTIGAFIGACFGGFVKSRLAYLYFIESNQATIFKTTMEAKKKLQDFMLVAFCKGAVHWGWRVGFFSGTFWFISTVIAVYRDENSVLEYVVAGFVTGAIYKANLGLAASVVGAGLGAFLSLIGGTAIWGMLKLSDASMEDIRRALYTIKESRAYNLREAEERGATVKHDQVTRYHDMIVSEKGEQKVEDL